MNFLIYGKSPQTITTTTEIEFLAKQTMSFATGSRGSTGTLCTITPADLKTFVLLGALAAPSTIAVVGGAIGYTVELRNEANVRSILAGGAVTHGGTSSGAGYGFCPSLVKGDILIGDGVKTFTLEVTAISGTTVKGSIYGYLIDT